MERSRARSWFGMVGGLVALRNPEKYFRNRARAASSFSMTMPGLGEVLFAGNAETVRELLAFAPLTFTPPLPNPIEPVVGQGSLILLSGERHRKERARLLSVLRTDRVRNYADAMAQAARDELRKWQPGHLVDMGDAARTIALHIMIQALFGVTEQRRCDDYVRVITAMMRVYSAPLMFIPSLRRAPAGLGPWGHFNRLRAELDEMLSEEITQRRLTGTDGYDDVLSALLPHDDGEHGDEQLRQQLRTLLVAGHETTATALTWMLYHVHCDESVRLRLQNELAGNPTPEAMTNLPYLGAVASEALRMHPSVPIVLRRLTCPVTAWKSPRVPGDVLGVALPALHADAAVWPDPDRFDPERFLVGRPTPAEYAPYGLGHRRCVGSAFANAELAVVLGTIMSCVDLRMTAQEQSRKPPHSVPQGISATPNRPITLEMLGRR